MHINVHVDVCVWVCVSVRVFGYAVYHARIQQSRIWAQQSGIWATAQQSSHQPLMLSRQRRATARWLFEIPLHWRCESSFLHVCRRLCVGTNMCAYVHAYMHPICVWAGEHARGLELLLPTHRLVFLFVILSLPLFLPLMHTALTSTYTHIYKHIQIQI